MENSDIIRKADMVLSDIASSGKLNPDQTDRFIRVLIDQPTLLQNVRTVAMKSPTMKVNKIGFGSRILAPGVENTALSSGQRVKPTFTNVQLNATEVMATIYLPYDVLEDNIEGGNVNVPLQTGAGGLHQTIVDMIAERVALDLEELALLGDTTSVDPYLALKDGFLKKIQTNVVDLGNATLTKDAAKSALKAMPPKYLRDRASLNHFFSVNNETELRDTYANRIGGFGDGNLTGNNPLFVYGSAIKAVPLMPSTSGIFTNPQNLLFGIWRNIMVEYNKNIETRQFVIVVTARIDFQIEEETACVRYQNISG